MQRQKFNKTNSLLSKGGIWLISLLVPFLTVTTTDWTDSQYVFAYARR